MTRNESILRENMLPLSRNQDWTIAKLEWNLKEVHFSQDKTCLCTHHPISELCTIQNIITNQRVIVGNCCVTKFIGIESRVFDSIKRVLADIEKSVNDKVVEHAYSLNIISEWEYNFYLDTYRKRKLSVKQYNKRLQINRKILQGLVHQLQSSIKLNIQ